MGRIGYPADLIVGGQSFRDMYIDEIMTDIGITRNDNLWPTPEGTVNMKRSTLEYTVTFRFDANPTRRITITSYALPSVEQ